MRRALCAVRHEQMVQFISMLARISRYSSRFFLTRSHTTDAADTTQRLFYAFSWCVERIPAWDSDDIILTVIVRPSHWHPLILTYTIHWLEYLSAPSKTQEIYFHLSSSSEVIKTMTIDNTWRTNTDEYQPHLLCWVEPLREGLTRHCSQFLHDSYACAFTCARSV